MLSATSGLMARVRHDLRQLTCETLSDTCAHFETPDGRLGFQAEEHIEDHFLMHVAQTRFVFRVPRSAGGQNRLTVRHTGTWKRTGIVCSAHGTNDPAIPKLADRITHDADLAAALLPLDFTRCELIQDALGWQVRVVHFGACEVVYRIPALRQYVRLASEQVEAMLASFACFDRLLKNP
jgi:hypothetical protein